MNLPFTELGSGEALGSVDTTLEAAVFCLASLDVSAVPLDIRDLLSGEYLNGSFLIGIAFQ